MKLTEAQSQFVEQVGRFWESVSMGRTGGRILGWLMISEPDHQSASQLGETLHISTGSVSTHVRQLERLGLLERVTFPGDRASYFRLPDRVWLRTMERDLERIAAMGKLAESGSELLPDTRPERVTELGAVVEFFAHEWPQLIERFSSQHEEGTP